MTHLVAAVVDPTRAQEGQVCEHAHRSEGAAGNCARRLHKRLTRGQPRPRVRAYVMQVNDDGTGERPKDVGVLL